MNDRNDLEVRTQVIVKPSLKLRWRQHLVDFLYKPVGTPSQQKKFAVEKVYQVVFIVVWTVTAVVAGALIIMLPVIPRDVHLRFDYALLLGALGILHAVLAEFKKIMLIQHSLQNKLEQADNEPTDG